MNTVLVQGVLQGVVVTVATGGATVLGTYTQTHNWTSALVAGGIAACAWVLSHYGTAGVQFKWQQAQPQPAPAPPAKP